MPFELTNAPATFQRLIDALFGPEMVPYVFGYLDDIIIASETFEEHQKWLEIVLTNIKDAQLTVNWKKCEFGCSRVRSLRSRGNTTRPGTRGANINVPGSQDKETIKTILGHGRMVLSVY